MVGLRRTFWRNVVNVASSAIQHKTRREVFPLVLVSEWSRSRSFYVQMDICVRSKSRVRPRTRLKMEMKAKMATIASRKTVSLFLSRYALELLPVKEDKKREREKRNTSAVSLKRSVESCFRSRSRFGYERRFADTIISMLKVQTTLFLDSLERGKNTRKATEGKRRGKRT